jgi:parallel beta-helix repeat protein
LSSSSDCNLEKNIANSNDDDGICLSSSCNCDITDNTVDSNNYGIRILAGSMHNKITNNNVSNNEEYGVYLHCSGNNEIYHNNIIENDKQAYDYKGFNDWDKGAIIGGNYWSDHNCTGNPSNGTEPYTKIDTDAGAVDNYPFGGPGGWIIIPQKGDLNGNGNVTPADAAIALQIAAIGAHNDAADVSGDGSLTSLDALMILQAAAGRIEL